MAECEYLQKCPFFNSTETQLMPQLSQMLRERFCLDDNSGCARFIVRSVLGPESIPALMAPFQIEWARQILLDNNIPQSQWAI